MAEFTTNLQLYKARKTDTKQTTLDELANNADKLDKKLRGFVNISDYDAVGDGAIDDLTKINTAISDAIAKGYAINWGNDGRTYLVSDTIPNFHTVKHIGNASVKRDSDVFFITPKSTQTNNVYVATTGSDTNDGLTANKPVLTIQKAFDYLANYAPILPGNWVVNLAAGTYTKATLKFGLLSENTLTIKGPSVGGYPNVPTAIVSNGAGYSGTGIQANGGSVVTIQDVKFTGYNGNSSSNGASCSEGSRLYTINVHCTDCFWGVTATHRSYLDVKGGIFDHCGYDKNGIGGGAAFRSLMLVNHYIGDQYGTALGIEVKNCYMGMSAQELSTGHVNWVNFHDNIDAVRLAVNSRANLDGCSFKRNTRDIRATEGSVPYVTSTVVFGTGVDESQNKLVMMGGANLISDSGVVIANASLGNNIQKKSFVVSYLNQNITSPTALAFYTASLKAPLWRYTPSPLSIGKYLYFEIYGQLNGSVNNKRINARLSNGGTSVLTGISFSATENGAFTARGKIYFTGADTQYSILESERHLGTSTRKSRAIGAVPMTTDVTFTLEASIDDTTAADSIIIDMIEVGWAG